MYTKLFRNNWLLYFLLWSLAAISGLCVVANVYLVQYLVDSLKQHNIQMTYTFLAAVSLCYFLQWSSNYGGDRFKQMLSNRIKRQEGEVVLRKVAQIPYECFEEKENLPVIDQVLKSHVTELSNVSELTSTIVTFVCTITGLLIYFCSVKWWYLLIVFLTTIPMWIMTIIGASREGSFANKAWKYRQKADKLSGILNSRAYIKEEKIFDFYSLVSRRWEENFEFFRKGKIKSSLGPRFITGTISFFQFGLTVLLLCFLIKDLRAETITTGMLISSMNAVWQILGQGLFTVVGIITGMVGFSAYASQERKLDAMVKAEKEGGLSLEEIESLELRHVSYHYPGEEKEVLKDINLVIGKGETIGLVGENGSGKSTLSKIIIGLLEPTEGEIWINGKCADSYDFRSRRKAFSCVFQDYGMYNFSMRENLLLSKDQTIEDEEIKTIIRRFDPDFLADVTDNLKQRLGRLTDDSRELSGGEWQKMAILRAILNPSSMFVLDEPTASIDPVLERDIVEHILQATEDKTSLIITHRMATVKQMDRIMVLKNGMIEESGSHQELMGKGGYYAELYKAQEQWYQ